MLQRLGFGKVWEVRAGNEKKGHPTNAFFGVRRVPQCNISLQVFVSFVQVPWNRIQAAERWFSHPECVAIFCRFVWNAGVCLLGCLGRQTFALTSKALAIWS